MQRTEITYTHYTTCQVPCAHGNKAKCHTSYMQGSSRLASYSYMYMARAAPRTIYRVLVTNICTIMMIMMQQVITLLTRHYMARKSM